MSRPLAAVITIVAIVATAALLMRATNTGGTATATPSSTTPTDSPSAAASVAARVVDGRFGFVTIEGDAQVRSETDATTLARFPYPARSFVFHSHAISPDGRQFAYWDRMSEGAVLNVRALPGGPARAVFTAAPGMFGNAYTWSSDGSGVVIATDNNCFGIPTDACRQGVAELWTVDLASGATERVATGKIWLPVVWDRANAVIAAGTTGEGGYLLSYDVIDLHQRPPIVSALGFDPPAAGRLSASSDARFVLLSGFAGTTTVAWWPLAQPAKRADVNASALIAAWRPGTSELWWVSGLTPPGCATAPCAGSEVVSLDVLTGARRTVARGVFPPALAGFRPDGSAAIVRGSSGLTLIDAVTGRAEDVAARGELLGAIRLR